MQVWRTRNIYRRHEPLYILVAVAASGKNLACAQPKNFNYAQPISCSALLRSHLLHEFTVCQNIDSDNTIDVM